MEEINLLSALPKVKRNITKRAEVKNSDVIAISKEYGHMYFDGPREYGYGGYYYDGRWKPVAKDIITYYNLQPKDKVLDIGCAKGFLVKDLLQACPGLEVFGIDVSTYAVAHCELDVVGRLHLGSADNLPFPDNSFDCVISLNTLHNFKRPNVLKALQEIQRVTKKHAFVQVDSFYTPQQKAIFESWVLTAEFYDYPEGWLQLFKEAGYTGDYYWTLID